MTRRLCTYKEAVTSDTETDWTRWKFAESLRRCIFFVNLINVLAAKYRRFHFDYFEPLDDALIFQMPLPPQRKHGGRAMRPSGRYAGKIPS